MEENKYPRIILGLDVSTSCVGACIIKDNGPDEKPELIAITHKSPKVPKKMGHVESLFVKKEFIEEGFLQCI